MIIFTVQDTKVKYLNTLCTQQNSQKEVYSVYIQMKFFNKVPNGWEIMGQGGFIKY